VNAAFAVKVPGSIFEPGTSPCLLLLDVFATSLRHHRWLAREIADVVIAAAPEIPKSRHP